MQRLVSLVHPDGRKVCIGPLPEPRYQEKGREGQSPVTQEIEVPGHHLEFSVEPASLRLLKRGQKGHPILPPRLWLRPGPRRKGGGPEES